MVDVTDPHFLQLLRIISPSKRNIYYTQMYHVNAIINREQKLDRLCGPPEENTVVQIGGTEPEAMAQATKILQSAGFPEVNINVGCPSSRVQAGSFGAVLMKTPERVHEILKSISNIGVTIPITVKCRIGVDEYDSYEYLCEFLEAITNQTPVQHIIVHARKAWLKGLSPEENRRIPPLDYSRVYRLRQDFPHLKLTINGGIETVEQTREHLKTVHGVMLGRKIRENPMFLDTLDRGTYL
ncbi:FMN-linked oxidoreductase [Basidiobolus meristosporus CBS 931.73]|uniref:FMN-linked oxidoreductase n=1 Tax=Basidiobolus meristosporus CBS 931.73 TaxID=1314790 RepID=A0A1Y1Y5V5_9FUNG|nr:FMN-linked oxidoreductase [Basidiobolus meristosporus CBS 931.73]|eukprot:ORX93411.1 FMN-linked oxidoreductase [Basidiobolus meristosporus CBS 931.73]